MKKRKLTIGLVSTFICGIALTSCVSAHDSYVVEFKDYSASELGLLSNSLYSSQIDTKDGITKYYDKVRELLIRASFEDVTTETDASKRLDVKTSYATLKTQASNKLEEQKTAARKNAKTNGTTYADEMDVIYSIYSCDDEESLYQHFLFELEEEQLKNAILDSPAQLKVLRDGSSNEDGWLKTARPYHIKHILCKVDGGVKEFTRAILSVDEAKNLSKVVELLVGGEKFDRVAGNAKLNGDSSANLGDVGIMTNEAKSGNVMMVPEFQLGIYAIDKLINGVDGAGLGLDATINLGSGDKVVSDVLAENGIGKVPYTAFLKLGEVAEYPKASEDPKLLACTAAVYPRNVLWNKYFNNHNAFVIVNASDSVSTNVGVDTQEFQKLYDGSINTTGNQFVAGEKSGFNNQGYLCDEYGRLIFGVRTEYGIHFIKIQKSAYEDSLQDYYPYELTNEVKEGNNFITAVDNNTSTYDTRFGIVKESIKGFANTEYRLYSFLKDYCIEKGIIDVTSASTQEILNKIDAHIETSKQEDDYRQNKGLTSVWQNYLRLVELQNRRRSEQYEDGYYYVSYTTSGTESIYKSVNRTALISEAVGDMFKLACDETDPAVKASYIAYFLEGAGGEYYYEE